MPLLGKLGLNFWVGMVSDHWHGILEKYFVANTGTSMK